MRCSGWILIPVAVALSIAPITPGAAQAPESEVRAAVRSLFDAMREGDGARVAELFHPEARLMSVVASSSGTALTSTPPGEFARAVGSPRDVVWDERITNLSVQVDGDLAAAWMDYSFYLGDQFSHCGVNAIQWAKTGLEWRIIQITDTRRNDQCG